MSQSYDKALILYEQGRYDLAQPLFQEHLMDRPDDGDALAYLALCCVRCGRVKEATEHAQRGVDAQPDQAFPHYAAAVVSRKRRRHKESVASIKRALGCSPENADYLAYRGLLHLDKKEHREALTMAEQGLSFSPSNLNSQNVRAMALTGLGQPGPGREVLESILQENPHDSLTLANLGWAYLHEHQWKEALDYFSRSLQEDPEGEFAREGMMEALRAQNPIYGFLLKYFLWLSRFSESSRWAIIVAETVLHRTLKEAARRHKSLRPFINFVLGLWSVFSYLTWVGRPLANLWLCLNPHGRKLLTNDEIHESGLVGGLLGMGGLAYGAWKLLGYRIYMAWMIVFLTIVLPASNIFDCPAGKPRNLMAGYTAILFGVGVYAIWALSQAPLTGGSAFGVYGMGLFAGRYLGIFLARQEETEEEG